ncbi:MAG TPA: cell division protein SepF [Clostridia bacterium]|nr:cell division protein SepF [Clostridia bacterium]
MAKIFDKMLDFLGVENDEYEEDSEEEYREEARPSSREREPIHTIRRRSEDAPDFQPPANEPRRRRPNLVGVPGGQAQPRQNLVLYQPQSNDDTQNIIDYMKAHRSVIINLEHLENETAQRILDYVSGASYALNGKIHKISSEIFLLAPLDASVMNNMPSGSKRERERDRDRTEWERYGR